MVRHTSFRRATDRRALTHTVPAAARPVAVHRPSMRPAESSRGPPLVNALTVASVWIMPYMRPAAGEGMLRPSPLTSPALTKGRSCASRVGCVPGVAWPASEGDGELPVVVAPLSISETVAEEEGRGEASAGGSGSAGGTQPRAKTACEDSAARGRAGLGCDLRHDHAIPFLNLSHMHRAASCPTGAMQHRSRNGPFRASYPALPARAPAPLAALTSGLAAQAATPGSAAPSRPRRRLARRAAAAAPRGRAGYRSPRCAHRSGTRLR
jgi:hypothetical protein